MGRLFGTDGIRGVANRELTPELAFHVGRAGAAVIGEAQSMEKPIVVARDTRLSGTMLEAAMIAGITSTGRNVIAIGVAPTPAVPLIATNIDAAAGVMISASHNPIEDNGIKFFGADGFKLSDATEDAVEAQLESGALPRPTHEEIGIATMSRGLLDRYFMALLEAGGDLAGLTVVVDAAFGAAYAVGPAIFARLGATVIAINAEDDGSRINVGCGATDLTMLAQRVRDEAACGAQRVVGVAFDGDADRALFVDETGATLSGDHVMLILARDAAARGALPGMTLVGTVMSNIGLERALGDAGIALLRAPVGDRYVLEAMRAGGFTFGGEQSGHIIDLTRNTTGDGPMTAVRLFSLLARSGRMLAEIRADLVVYPQVLVNVRVSDKAVMDDAVVVAAIEAARATLGGGGRILVRPSGTEPLIRVMVEADSAARLGVADDVARTIAAVAGNRVNFPSNG